MNLNKYKKSLEGYGIDDKAFQKEKKKLSKRFKKEANDSDVIWSLFNNLLIKCFHDFHQLKMIYYKMALFLDEEGENSFQIRQLSSKMELMEYKKSDILKSVKTLSAKNSCDECKRLNGKIFLINKALKEMPIPCKKCTRKMNNDKFSFCRCCWIPEI